ncbi:MAG: DUF192 domain-containing protein [Patescibacteria group bacterium]|nr:DUF192 domain-containing protein [Patescibacteria group bacterium]
MKRLFIFALLALSALFVFLNYKHQIKKTPQAIINNHIFNLEIAKTDKEKEVGLAKYNSIPKDFSMIFPFGKSGFYSFWMKNMKFPIDIIFIKNGKIVKIFSDVPPPTSPNSSLPIYKPDEPSDTVLEINAGLSKEYKFQKNDTVIINY